MQKRSYLKRNGRSTVDACDLTHDAEVGSTTNPEGLVRYFPNLPVRLPGIVGAERREFRAKGDVLIQVRESEQPRITVLPSRRSRLLHKAALENKFPEWSIAVQEPVTIHAANYVPRSPAEARGLGSRPILLGQLTRVVEDENTPLREYWLHRVEHLLHSRTVVLIIIMHFAQHIKDHQGRVFLRHEFGSPLAPRLACYQEGERHIVLMDEAQVRYIESNPRLIELAESLSPRGFLGIQLEIEHLLWSRCVITHEGMALRYSRSNVPCKEALTRLGLAHQEEVCWPWNEALDEPGELGTRYFEILKRADSANHSGDSFFKQMVSTFTIPSRFLASGPSAGFHPIGVSK